MSADNWRRCPRCLKEAAEEHDKDLARFQEAYGKVPVGEYERLRARAEKEPTVPNHLREDYEMWMTDEGEFNVRYRGDCQDCPYVFVFQHTIKTEV